MKNIALTTNRTHLPFERLKGFLSHEVSSHHIILGPSKVVPAKVMAEVSFLFGGAEPQLTREPSGTIFCFWASGAQSLLLAIHRSHECCCARLMAQYYFFPNITL